MTQAVRIVFPPHGASLALDGDGETLNPIAVKIGAGRARHQRIPIVHVRNAVIVVVSIALVAHAVLVRVLCRSSFNGPHLFAGKQR